MGRGRGPHRRDPCVWEGGGVAAKGRAPPVHLLKNTSIIPPTCTLRVRGHPRPRAPRSSGNNGLHASHQMRGAPGPCKVMSVREQYQPARHDALEERRTVRGWGTPPPNNHPRNTMRQLHVNKYVMFDEKYG